MQAKDFYNYMADPGMLEKSSISELQQLVNEFPYFQSAHLLLTLAGKKWDSSVYQHSLKKTAIVAPNRTQLFKLVQDLEKKATIADEKVKEKIETVSAPVEDKAKEELDILKAAELSTGPEPLPVQEEKVETAEVILAKEIGKQVVASFIEKEILKTNDLEKVQPKEEPESFGDWLAFLKKNNGQSYSEISGEVTKAKEKKEKEKATEGGNTQKPATSDERKQKNKALIDKIIEKNPGSIKSKEEARFFAPDLKARESLLENEHLVTETLARIYALQGSNGKAIRAYEILSLKYPQKSAYFASLIEKLRNNQ